MSEVPLCMGSLEHIQMVVRAGIEYVKHVGDDQVDLGFIDPPSSTAGRMLQPWMRILELKAADPAGL